MRRDSLRGKKIRGRGVIKSKRMKKQRIVILSTSIMILLITILIWFGVSKEENNIVQASNGNKIEAINDDKLEEIGDPKKKLDNSGYLTLEEDPNADDALIVSENINCLITGKKTYPVRTDGKKVVYLTFDDGPSTTITPKILDILDKYNVKGTFFILGSSLDKNAEANNLLKEEAKRGHAIANHTYSHNYNYLYPGKIMNVENIVSDIEKNNEAMRNVLGKDFSTRVIRFPGGYWSWNGRVPMKEKMIENGYCNVDWNALNGDAEGNKKNAQELFETTKKGVEALGVNADNIVILMHDTYGKEETAKALPQIIEYLQGKGFEFRTMK